MCVAVVYSLKWCQMWDNLESSFTDYSDHEGASGGIGFHPAAGLTSTPKTSREDLRRYRIPEEEFPNKHIRQESLGWGENANTRRRRKAYVSDSEIVGQVQEGREIYQQNRRYQRRERDFYAPSLASIRSTSLSSLHSNQVVQSETCPGNRETGAVSETDDANGHKNLFLPTTGRKSDTFPRGSYGAALFKAGEDYADVSNLYVNHGQPQKPFLFQGNTINHLYATNPHDGRSAIHRAIECTGIRAGLDILNLLSKKDPEVVNLQDRDGFSPLHLACQLERKRIVKKLLNLEKINLNLRTFDGRLPEEMTTTASIQNLLKKARQNTSTTPEAVEEDVRLVRAVSEISHPTVRSTVDFESLERRFEEQKQTNET